VWGTSMWFDKAFTEIVAHLKEFHDSFDQNLVQKIVSLILSSNQVFSYGAGRSGLIARCFAQRMMHLGLRSFQLGETITPSLNSSDVLLVVSGSGETLSSVTFIKEAKKVGARTIALTSKNESRVAKSADFIVMVPGKTKTDKYDTAAPFTSLFDVSALVFLDSLASELMKRLKVTEDDILRRHATIE
jgi:6-phospho-3-hexuloisomerase